jgi:hypothetical protein
MRITQQAASNNSSKKKSVPHRTKKKLIRRTGTDRSQVYRRVSQGKFLILNLWLGTKFYFWVCQFELGNTQSNLQRPPGVEGWLPIAGLMNSFCSPFSPWLPVSQSVLQLALSDWNNLRVSVESREAVFWPQGPATEKHRCRMNRRNLTA